MTNSCILREEMIDTTNTNNGAMVDIKADVLRKKGHWGRINNNIGIKRRLGSPGCTVKTHRRSQDVKLSAPPGTLSRHIIES